MFSGSAVAARLRNGDAAAGDLTQLRDDQLLVRFFQMRDDAAFSTLVQRYGPLVYGVCQRILHEAADAEDAFQATFLVLVRKGETLREPGRLANWLYGVAYRTAHKFRAKAALRTRSEREAGKMATTSEPGAMTYEELQAVLNEEISQLPEKYALPLVLCYLEGKTNAQAAAQLGWPEGSMSRRLSRARELLKSRLAKRGLALSAALVAAVFSRPVAAAVPQHLLEATANAGRLVAQGAAMDEVVSPAVATAVHDVGVSLAVSTRQTLSAVLAVAALVASMIVVVWEIGAPAYAASVALFHRAQGLHARQGAVGAPGSLVSLPGSAASAGACGSQTAGACSSGCSSLSAPRPTE